MQRQPGRGHKEMRHEREARLEANRIAHEQCAALCPWLIAICLLLFAAFWFLAPDLKEGVLEADVADVGGADVGEEP